MATSVKRKASDPNIAEGHKKRSTQANTIDSAPEGDNHNAPVTNDPLVPEQENGDDNGASDDRDITAKNTTSRRNGRATATESHDIHIARETAELFKSNIFKLQIDELLEQVKLKQKHVLKVEKFLHKLYDILQEIPDWEEKTLAEVDSFFKNKTVSVPFVDPKPVPQTTNYKFNYKKPDISLIGSFALKAGIYQPNGSSIDTLLTMPSEMFEKKDFLNFRCLHKRSVYLAYLTHHLSISLKKHKLDSFLQIEYSYFDNDPLLPILRIFCSKPTSDSPSEYNFYKTRFSINLVIGFPYRAFEPKKLLPNRNCIRIAQESKEVSLPATPLYNFSVLSSTTHENYLKYLYKTKKQTESFIEATVLGRLWLQQRGFSSKMSHSGSLGGFGTFEFTVLMAALLNGGGVNSNKILLHGFSSYQLFKGVIKYLATMDLCHDGHLQFHSDAENSSSSFASKYIDEGFQTPTLFDKSTKVNILTKMTVSSYQILKEYAGETLKMLNNVVQDQFSNIFLTNVSSFDNLKYDLCYDIQLPLGNYNDLEASLATTFGSMERVKYITLENFLVHKITNIARYALGDRIKFLQVEMVGQKSNFPITKRKVYSNTGGNHFNFDFLRLKLSVNPAECEKLVTKGPAHSETMSTEAAVFKNFWGIKSSLRRFKDGSITHCCVWSTSSSEPIISSIVDFVLQKHISKKVQVSNDITKQFQNFLPLPNLPSSASTSVLNLSSFFNLKKSFDDIYKIVFQMKLPLSVKSILPVGSAFRYTSLCQPVPFAYSDPDFFQDVILEFETSPKWPDEITSLEKAKTAFLLKIQEDLSTNRPTYKSFFTRDESIPYNLEIVTLNILTPEGYGFKFRVLTERDEILYLRAIANARNELKPELENTFLKFTGKYLASVRHTRNLENISHSYQFYSPVVRLFKKWLDTHLLLGHISDELAELIAIKPFVDHAPYFIPGSVENGFLKVLKFISQWNWKDDALILDLVKSEDDIENSLETSIGAGSELDSKTMKRLSERLTLSQYKGIQMNFANLRNSDPNGTHLQFFVASKNDPSGILYSSGIPLPIATRLTALAKVAVNLLQTHGLNKQTIDLLFTPGLKDYDFVIDLRTPVGLKSSCGILSITEFKNITNDQAPSQFPEDLNDLSEKMDPTYQLVKYLNLKYKNSLILSSRKYIGVNGGEKGDRNVITGLIKPLFKGPHKFRVNLDCNIVPVDDDNVVLNKEAIFHEIAAFGNDMVVKFETD
ncbi:rRNA-processing protein UTP22 [Saccharomyces eubayanus]|uniref:rRNA-processing protein UTP22 n=1 Tax=Saccharomyces eubayanus TaxID=1080349 RepID=UPI0006C43CC3|nr:UTP22-like protein [Saccharomyces eubayanus]KOG99583.1 UTP22-like protein [Saccharomyces eubayanus]